jgi:hypothetical protein
MLRFPTRKMGEKVQIGKLGIGKLYKCMTRAKCLRIYLYLSALFEGSLDVISGS